MYLGHGEILGWHCCSLSKCISVSDKIMVPFLLICLQFLCLNRKEEVLQCDDVSFNNDMAKCVKSDRKSKQLPILHETS